MLLTSYYSNYRHFPSGKRLVSVSRYIPKGFTVDSCAPELAPSASLLEDYKRGLVDEVIYESRYTSETLEQLDPVEIGKQYANSIFLCYEKTGDFCHRHILSKWLNAHGINTEEVASHVTIAVVGSRGFDDYAYFKQVMDRLVCNYSSFSFCSGGAKSGADRLIERYSKEGEHEIKIHYPDWAKHGKSAGFVRNTAIWDDCTFGIAFWDGKSKGTAHSFDIAAKQGKKLYVVEYLKRKIYMGVK